MMEQSFFNTDAIFAWLRLHPYFTGLIAFTISGMESVAIIGTIIPGTIMMTGLGALAGAGIVSFFSIMIWAIAGAVFGDYLSYWCGRYYKEALVKIWPFKQHPEWLNKGKSFFIKHGGKSVFFGRFIGPVRALTPVIAGMMNLSPARFLFANVLSAILWAPAYMLPGIILGAASTALPPSFAFRLLVGLLVILLSLWVLLKILAFFYHQFLIKTKYGLFVFQNLTRTNNRFLPFFKLIKSADSSHDNDMIIFLMCGVSALILFIVQIFQRPSTGIVSNLDNIIFNTFNNLRLAATDHLMATFTVLSDEKLILAIWIITLVHLMFSKQWRTAFYWFILVIGVVTCCELTHYFIYSPYPGSRAILLNGSFFPDRHIATITSIISFWIIIIAYNLHSPFRKILFYISIFIVAIACIAELHFGVSWFSSVCGGLLIGIACTAFVTFFYLRKEIPSISIYQLTMPALFIWLIAGSVFLYNYHSEIIKSYKTTWPTRTLNENIWWQQTQHPLLFYRLNRMGTPTEIMNLQVLCGLNEFAASLTNQGWHLHVRRDLGNMLKLLIGSQQDYIPLLRETYHGKPPILLLSKQYSKNRQLVLKLWDPDIIIQPTHQRLWIGTLNFYQLQKNEFFAINYYNKLKENTVDISSPSTEFIKFIKSYQWQQLAFHKKTIETSHGFETTHVLFLLVKKKNP